MKFEFVACVLVITHNVIFHCFHYGKKQRVVNVVKLELTAYRYQETSPDVAHLQLLEFKGILTPTGYMKKQWKGKAEGINKQ